MKKIQNFLAVLTDGIDKVERWILTAIFAEAIVVGFMQVVCRFVLKASLPWSEELLRFSFIWLTYMAASMGIVRGTHADVRVVVDRLPMPAQKALNIFREVATLAFCFIIFRFSIDIIVLQVTRGQVSTAMKIPMFIPYSGITVSFGLMVIQSFARLFTAIDAAFVKKPEQASL